MNYDKWAVDGLNYEYTPWRLKLIPRIKHSRYTLGRGTTGRAKGAKYDIIRPQTLSTARTSKAGPKKIRDSRRIMPWLSVTAATATSRHIQRSTTLGRSKGWGKKGLTELSWPLTYIRKKTENWKQFIGKKLYKSLKFYLSLLILDGIAYWAFRDYATQWYYSLAFILSLWFVNQSLLRK